MAADRRSLRIAFESQEELAHEYATNLVHGGIFIAGQETLQLREAVNVVIELRYCDETLELPGEVVSLVPAGLARAGGTPGVAVQLEARSPELAKIFGARVEAVPPKANERDQGAGRRATPRAPARFIARWRSRDGVDQGCRTRDLSIGGVLVSVEGEAAPIGAEVVFGIRHPNSGEELEIPGSVARHLKSESGRVTAMGIAFAPDPESRSEVHRFVAEVQSAEHSRRLGGITGSLDAIDLASWIQSLASSAPMGTLTLVRGAEEGFIAFKEGGLLAVHLGAVRGIKALARLLGWTEGHFEFHALVDARLQTMKRVPLNAALMKAFSQLEEREAPGMPSLGPDQVVTCVRSDSPKGELTKLEAALLERAAGGVSIAELLDALDAPDYEVRVAAAELIERGRLSVGE